VIADAKDEESAAELSPMGLNLWVRCHVDSIRGLLLSLRADTHSVSPEQGLQPAASRKPNARPRWRGKAENTIKLCKIPIWANAG
jgi:hypothetical protein